MAPGTVDNEAPSTEKSCEKPAFADKIDKEIEQKTIKTDGSDSGKFLGLLPIFSWYCYIIHFEITLMLHSSYANQCKQVENYFC